MLSQCSPGPTWRNPSWRACWGGTLPSSLALSWYRRWAPRTPVEYCPSPLAGEGEDRGGHWSAFHGLYNRGEGAKMLPERRTIGALLGHLAQAIPQQEAVVLPPRRLTYAVLYAEAT